MSVEARTSPIDPDPRHGAPPPSRGGGRRLGPKLLLLVGVTALGCTLLEVAARVRMNLRYGRATAEVYPTFLDEESGLRLPVPGTYGPVNINSQGFRGPPVGAKSEAIRLAFLGGSTTFCAEAGEDEATWPAQVCQKLAVAAPPKRFEYVNAALQGFGLSESSKNLLHRVRPLEPDAILIYHATNDIVRDTRARAQSSGLDASWGDERSWLARRSVAWDLIEKNLRVAARKKKAAEGTALLDCDEQELAARFQSRLEQLIRDARERTSVVAVLTFSTRLRAEQDDAERMASSTTSILYMPYMDPPRLLRVFAAYNDAIRKAAAATGAILIEAELGIPGDATHFQDSVHLTGAGCERMATIVTETLNDAPAFRALYSR